MRRLIVTAAALLLAVGSAFAARVNVRPDSRIEVVYLTAKDCVYCRSWRYTMAGDWSRFSQTDVAKSIQLVTVDKVTLRNRMKREYYAAEYAHLFDRAPQFGNAVPSWWVLVDGQPVTRRLGEDAWKRDLEPVLEKLVKAKLSGGGVVEHGGPPPARPAAIPSSVADADGVPYLTAKGRDAYRSFLNGGKPKAFALSPDGVHSWRSGGSDPAKTALDTCNAYATDAPCQVYAVDDKVVYKLD